MSRETVLARRVSLGLVLMLCGSGVAADDERAHFNYMMHCQGCHLADAAGSPGLVPRMKDFVGHFLRTADGREFLVRVPGVAGAPLPDDELTDLLNWMLVTFSREQLPPDFTPYSVAEVALLRTDQETDPEARRAEILRRIATVAPQLALQPELPEQEADGRDDH